MKYLFYILFFLTPLIWYPYTSELFEFNKMYFVYLMTALIVTTWAFKPTFKRTPLDIPLLLFLAANIASTLTSIDPHTSWWGYYSRSNGGLWSTISYILLYYAFVSNLTATEAIKSLKMALWGGTLVALWAIPEHFGVSLSCVMLGQGFTADCWVQDVQARVFATLGQPNWLAAYMEMLIFPALYFLLTEKNPDRVPSVSSRIAATPYPVTGVVEVATLFLILKDRQKLIYLLQIILFYLAFTFTYSRGATFGLIGGFLVLSWYALRKVQYRTLFTGIVVVFLFINILFGSALTDFKLVNQFAPPPRPGVSLGQSAPQGTVLENGGTESGQIRLIVWRGALEIFKHYPVFGSGVETFGYSYYNFRPVEHNLVSEWDFLYNKAHNEFLNYLATTGAVGFASYLLLIGWFLVWVFRRRDLFSVALAASLVAYLIQNFFGFSVVIVALFFYLFPAVAFVTLDVAQPLRFRLPKAIRIGGMIVVVIGLLLTLNTLINHWQADRAYALGSRANEQGSPLSAYRNLLTSTKLNREEPLYKSELGYAEAGIAVLQADTDATLSAALKEAAVLDTKDALSASPANLTIWRTAIRMYFLLATIDPAYLPLAIQTVDQTQKLAPTDPNLPYYKGLILQRQPEGSAAAVEALQQSITLKPNYREAHFTLGEIYFAMGQKDKALSEMAAVLRLVPGDADATAKIEEWNR